MRDIKCSYCEEYRNEWCEKVTDSPHPDILRDCQYFHETKTRWIPCSERLPEEKDAGILKKLGTNKRSDYVIATVEVKGERMTAIACTYDGAWDWNMKYAFPNYKIIAWMPLPEPYKGEE